MSEVDINLYKILDQSECHMYFIDNQIETVAFIDLNLISEFTNIFGDNFYQTEGESCILFTNCIRIDPEFYIEYLGHELHHYGDCFEEWEKFKDRFKE
jgi:hypothetical protein